MKGSRTPLRRLAGPVPVRLAAGRDGRPCRLSGTLVEAICEEWWVEEGWWTGRPLRRRYFELALEDGARAVVFDDRVGGGWFAQRA